MRLLSTNHRQAGQQLHAFRLAFADWVVIYRKKRLEEKALSLSLKDIESEDSRLKVAHHFNTA